jgi:hypothetical protein
MTRSLVQIRISLEEKKLWQEASDGNISKWLKRLATEDIQEQKAEQHERELKRSEREQLVKTSFPQEAKCKHVQVGQYCYKCKRSRWA